MGHAKTRNKNRKRANKYVHLHKPIPELPRDVIEHIIQDHVHDNKTKAVCKCLDKAFNELIIDLRTVAIHHQEFMMKLLTELCSGNVSYFNLSINAEEYRIIITDEAYREVYLRVYKKGLGAKPLTRCFVLPNAVNNIGDLLKRQTIFKGSGTKAQELFSSIFGSVRCVNLRSEERRVGKEC